MATDDIIKAANPLLSRHLTEKELRQITQKVTAGLHQNRFYASGRDICGKKKAPPAWTAGGVMGGKMILRFPEFSRDMHSGEEGAVDDLLVRVHGGDGEAKMVHALRRAGAMAGEVVLPYQGAIVGYYALSQMRAPDDVLCLGPLAIHPDWQRSGHGRRMIGLLSEWARISGTSVVAQGCMPFFACAGFRAGPVAGMSQAGPKVDVRGADLVYPAAFRPA